MCLPFMHKYGPIDSQGFIWCTKCGNPKYVGFPKCTHPDRLDTIEVIKKTHSVDSISTTSLIYVQQCPRCGKITKTTVDE